MVAAVVLQQQLLHLGAAEPAAAAAHPARPRFLNGFFKEKKIVFIKYTSVSNRQL